MVKREANTDPFYPKIYVFIYESLDGVMFP